MADRIVKQNENAEHQKTTGSNDSKSEGDNGAASSEEHPPGGPPTLLRPSVFRPPASILSPSRLGSNPFSASPTNTSSEGSSVLAPGRLANNPFAKPSSRGSSDSEDEKGSKCIVAPATFIANKKVGSPFKGSNFSQANPGATPKFMLRPSALDKQTESFNKAADGQDSSFKTSFKLEPAKMQNPFMKTIDEKESPSKNDTSGGATSDCSEKKEEKSTKCESGASSEPPKEQSQDDSGPSFIFGQNIRQRVVGSERREKDPPGETNSEAGANSSYMFGENLAEKANKPPDNNVEEREPTSTDGANDRGSPHKTLEESAAAHQAKQTKPELQKVDVVTGEENESNVIQTNVKLFAFEKDTQNWVERGRGLLRLNDMSTSDAHVFQSRLVMRTQGSLRVVLNTKLWSGMMVERASSKTVRFSATEDDIIRIFLIMASSNDADQMFSAIDHRVQQLKLQECQRGADATSEDVAPPHATPPKQDAAASATGQGQKRTKEEAQDEAPCVMKKPRFDPEKRRDIVREESNDSSTLDPETEVSNESFTSTNKSSSSE